MEWWQRDTVHKGITALLYAAVFFMPWWQAGLEWAVIAATVLALADMVLSRNEKLPILPVSSGALILFALWAYLSTWQAPSVFDSMYNYFYFVGMYVVMYLMVAKHICSAREENYFLFFFLAGACVVAVFGLYQYFTESVQGTAAVWTDAERFPLLRRRMYSTLGNPNLLGAYLVLICSMLASMTVIKEHGWKRWMFGGLMLVFLLILALTYSRGAWAAALAVLIVAALVHDRRLAWALAVIPLFILLHQGQLTERFLSVFTGADTSVALRFAFWDSTWQMIGEHPWLGIGWGSFFLVYPHYDYYLQDASVLIYHAHNMYLNIAAETGWPGLFFYLLAFWGHGFLAWRLYRYTQRPLRKALGLGVFLCVVGMSVNGITDYNFFNRTVSLSFWTMCALMVAAYREDIREREVSKLV